LVVLLVVYSVVLLGVRSVVSKAAMLVKLKVDKMELRTGETKVD